MLVLVQLQLRLEEEEQSVEVLLRLVVSHEQADDGVGHMADLVGFVNSMLKFHELLGNVGTARFDGIIL